ncbi:hypothetical protein ACJX0J_020549, partial [Zea mays]
CSGNFVLGILLHQIWAMFSLFPYTLLADHPMLLGSSVDKFFSMLAIVWINAMYVPRYKINWELKHKT